jgi:hypothetical protein
MTRTFEEKKRVLELWQEGYNKLQIAKETGIPRGTVKDCLGRYSSIEKLEQKAVEDKLSTAKAHICDIANSELRQSYAYLLGLYLGDGCISLGRKTDKLRITLDSQYPNIVENCPQILIREYEGIR